MFASKWYGPNEQTSTFYGKKVKWEILKGLASLRGITLTDSKPDEQVYVLEPIEHVQIVVRASRIHDLINLISQVENQVVNRQALMRLVANRKSLDCPEIRWTYKVQNEVVTLAKHLQMKGSGNSAFFSR